MAWQAMIRSGSACSDTVGLAVICRVATSWGLFRCVLVRKWTGVAMFAMVWRDEVCRALEAVCYGSVRSVEVCKVLVSRGMEQVWLAEVRVGESGHDTVGSALPG